MTAPTNKNRCCCWPCANQIEPREAPITASPAGSWNGKKFVPGPAGNGSQVTEAFRKEFEKKGDDK